MTYGPESSDGRNQKSKPFLLFDLYYQFIKLTPFTMPAFEIFYCSHSIGFAGNLAVFGA
jgi:hypothetical protein